MELILPFLIPPLTQKISYQDKIMLIGSCFSTEIGKRLQHLKFDIFQNPSGIIYHPQVIAEILSRTVQNKYFVPDDVFKHEGIYHSWFHHSSFSGGDKDEVLKRMNQCLGDAHNFLKQTRFLILTPATAFGYFSKDTGEIVANCHKVPSTQFEKRLIKSAEITNSLLQALGQVKKFNPKLVVIFTVSPVRHIRDGLSANNRSKAEVISSVHSIVENGEAEYFPSYEIVNDVLRDYRFFREDMVHPSEIAIDFVFNEFTNYAMETDSIHLMNIIKGIEDSFLHRPRFPGSVEHLRFVHKQLEKIQQVKHEYPFLNLKSETDFYQSILKD